MTRALLCGLRMALHRRLARFISARSGAAAVEFALLLPVIMLLYLGGVEVTQAISIDRKVTISTRAVADLVAQGTKITSTEMQDILAAGKAVIAPYPPGKLKVVVSSVRINASKIARIAWSCELNSTARPVNQTVTTLIPPDLLIANTYLIWAEVSYGYTPTIGYVITNEITLNDRLFMRPRLQDQVELQNCG